ncbi:hypothetical protein [Erwinia mallotivora]|uniref:hypothetical protein n=1 Tax=Erwinia mallotivora TaxID=69222 RepID=UPI0021BEF34C|nr:hypothetical protein [Erwinia mallotivora]
MEIRGSRVNAHISLSEIDRIQKATNKNDVPSLWGKIKDWFCGTKTEKAKICLYEIYNEATDNKQKLNAFFTLINLVSPAYKNRFKFSLDDNSIKIKIADVDRSERKIELPEDQHGLLDSINDHFGHYSSKETIKGLKQDINRADYKFSFYDKEYDFDHRDKSKYQELYNLKSKEQLINELTLGDHQKKYLGILASQALPLAMLSLRSDYRTLGSKHDLSFSVTTFAIKNSLHYDKHLKIDMQFSNKIPEVMREFDESQGLYPEVKCTASFLINSEKTCLLSCEWQGIGDRI